jgi:hypothetical protein
VTEREWEECWLHVPMLNHLRSTASPRKLRLLALAYCNVHRARILHKRMLRALDVLEQYADGLATSAEMVSAANGVWNTSSERGGIQELTKDDLTLRGGLVKADDIREGVAWAARSAIVSRADAFDCVTRALNRVGKSVDACFLTREVFGNPCRPITFDPRWLSSDVVGLSEAIYQERAFDQMPILADALMDAGCDNEDILNHCRSDQPHCRGCWVVDLILAKS